MSEEAEKSFIKWFPSAKVDDKYDTNRPQISPDSCIEFAKHFADQQNKELESKLKAVEELLQYVADNHLCGTPLIEGMKKVGIKEQLIRTDELKKNH